MYYCPCCSDVLLKHIHHSHSFWFCRTCWQEMPILSWHNYPHYTNIHCTLSTENFSQTRNTRYLTCSFRYTIFQQNPTISAIQNTLPK